MGGFTDDPGVPAVSEQGGFADTKPTKTVSPIGTQVVDVSWDTKPFSRKPAKHIYGSCAVCGGSDHPVIGLFTNPPFSGSACTGHKLGCPRGKVGTPIGEDHG